MTTNTHVVFLPGAATINPVTAIKKAIVKLGRVKKPMEASREYLERLKTRFNQAMPTAPGSKFKERIRVERPTHKARRIRRELLDAGATFYGILKSESRHLPKILHDYEHIEAVIYGQHQDSSAMLAATDERIIYLDKKPMAVMFDEVSYEVVSGIEFDIHIFYATVVLHTPVRNYDFSFVNLHCAEKFARYIESQRLERDKPEQPQRPVIEVEPDGGTIHSFPSELKEDMAGYYWLPTEEEERRRAGVGPL